MPRRRLAAIVLAAVAFLVVSAFVARWLTVENAERDAVLGLVQTEARGDAAGMLRRMDGCATRPACAASVRAAAARTRRAGSVQIVALDSATAHALSTRTGFTRVVWRTPQTLTVVQCVRVRRQGSPLGRMRVLLLGITPPLRRTAPCP